MTGRNRDRAHTEEHHCDRLSLARPRSSARRRRDQALDSISRAAGRALFARKDIQEIARFITTESILLHEHFRRILAAPFKQSLSHLSGNLSFREEQRQN